MPTAHLLFGFLGAGKTTLARDLEQRHRAVRFTPDEWMARLFGEDPPADTFPQHAAAILDLMEPIWTRCLHLGLDVVLDYGFWRRAQRDHARHLAEACGARAILYKVECREEEAWRRVATRNGRAERSLYIAPETFDALKGRFEPLHADEAFVAATSRQS
ncbi:AAA family ATPase [Methylobacterium aquaticum]|uniref:AAA family ATPase n=1 Tax=Methylobacterium aquaticum TaxID=270351 RepID=UPI003D17A442